jgi:hypothetical protein
MTLPMWAKPPGPNYEHRDNYSGLEVVWTDDEGRVMVQTQRGYVDLAVDVLRIANPEDPDLAVAVIDSNLRLATRVRVLERNMATRVELVVAGCAAGLFGLVGGVLVSHVWHP